MKIKNTIKILAAGISSMFIMSSCSDFLNIIPMNEIVLDNYWTEKSDVQNVVLSCYTALEKPECLTRMAIWGELRSDNFIVGMGAPNDVNQILKENILTSNDYLNWTSIYSVINRCNTVLHYAPGVHEIDPDYTFSDLQANIAEVTAIRALCYFYLIRTFGNVPYVTEPSIDDDQEFKLPASTFDEILLRLTSELEEIKDFAVRKYSDKLLNTARITRYGIYALLADLYLWKNDYDRCIEYCDMIINYKKEEYELEKENSNLFLELYNNYPLISEQFSTNMLGNAYTEIFGDGDSFESIFELQFVNNQSQTNSYVNDFYGSSSVELGYLSASEFIFKDVFAGTNLFFKKTDCRNLENADKVSGMFAVGKYVRESTRFNVPTNTSIAPVVAASKRTNAYSNWIIYRLTDIMLMKAEALVQKVGDVDPNNPVEEQQILYKSAFSLVSSVYNRANNLTGAKSDTLVYDNYAISKMDMENLILLERQRELMFEGKRWFDLVRLSKREGNNNRLINLVVRKFNDNQQIIKKKLESPYAIFYPYNKNELKVNPYLVQNPAYSNESSK